MDFAPQGQFAAAGSSAVPAPLSSASREGDPRSAKEDSESKASWFSQMGEAGITVGLVTMLLFLRLFAVARWDWTVAASLAESFNFDDAVSIALGTLFERPVITGVIISLVLPVALFRDYWLSSVKATWSRANNWFLIVALVVTAYVLTRTLGYWWVLASAVILALGLIVSSRLAKKKGWSRGLARIGTHLGIVVGVLLLVVATTIETPWVEEELIETKDESFYGYVLDSDPGFLKIMTVDREIVIMPDSNVISRTIVD